MANNDDITVSVAEIEKIIAEFEVLFKDRYTDADADYVAMTTKPVGPPPCVENWYTRPKRTFDWTNQRGDRGRGRGRGYYGHQGQRSHDNYNRNNRDYRDQGQGHQGRVHYAGRRQDYEGQGHGQNRYQPYGRR
ncbi:unnamed protein product [Owenia fusiformis]|uniref:Uncharacterized protein n=1 Tax=Owenia fusiformis TaxID=6347 RepID=A0A8J1UKV1_OWEFU|nr:unnamed protein product [Owenia fusiformis]